MTQLSQDGCHVEVGVLAVVVLSVMVFTDAIRVLVVPTDRNCVDVIRVPRTAGQRVWSLVLPNFHYLPPLIIVEVLLVGQRSVDRLDDPPIYALADPRALDAPPLHRSGRG